MFLINPLCLIDHSNGGCHRLVRFTCIFVDMEEWNRPYIDDTESPKVQLLRMHQIKGSPGVSVIRIMFSLHVYNRGSSRGKKRRQP